LKQPVEIDISARHPEVDVSSLDSHIDETLAEVPKRRDFNWAWILWLNRRQLIRWTAAGVVLSVVIALMTPKRFDSTTRLMPPDSRSGVGGAMMAAMASQGGSLAGSALGGIAGDLLGVHETGAVFTEMLRSRTLQDRIVSRLNLRKVYGTLMWEDARNRLTLATAISEDRKSGVITITVTDRDPQRAQQIAQSYVEELDRIAADVNTSAAHRERVFIEERLKAVKADLDAASQKFSEYSSKNATLDIKSEGVAMVQAAAVLRGQLIAAQSELEGLEQIYTSSNIRVRSLRARVDELRRQLKKVGGDSSEAGSKPFDSDQDFPSIRQLPMLGVRWEDLYREAEVQGTVYKLLTEQYEMAKLEEAKETPVVKVLDPAVVPERKSGPARTLLVMFGTALAFGFGVAWILGGAAWKQMDPRDSRKQLGGEIIAHCKAILVRGKSSARILRSRFGRNDSTKINV
jgi:uncharacterized protein involved in exopolysaccharide biosynthesis